MSCGLANSMIYLVLCWSNNFQGRESYIKIFRLLTFQIVNFPDIREIRKYLRSFFKLTKVLWQFSSFFVFVKNGLFITE